MSLVDFQLFVPAGSVTVHPIDYSGMLDRLDDRLMQLVGELTAHSNRTGVDLSAIIGRLTQMHELATTTLSTLEQGFAGVAANQTEIKAVIEAVKTEIISVGDRVENFESTVISIAQSLDSTITREGNETQEAIRSLQTAVVSSLAPESVELKKKSIIVSKSSVVQVVSIESGALAIQAYPINPVDRPFNLNGHKHRIGERVNHELVSYGKDRHYYPEMTFQIPADTDFRIYVVSTASLSHSVSLLPEGETAEFDWVKPTSTPEPEDDQMEVPEILLG